MSEQNKIDEIKDRLRKAPVGSGYYEDVSYLLQEIERLKEKNERKDEALRFYADVKNYEEVEVAENQFVSPEITLDAGERAREAL